MNILPTMVSASDLQRDSSRLIKLAKSSDQPVIVVKNNIPEVAIINLKRLQALIDKERDWEIKDTLEAVKEGEEDRKAGRLITLSEDRHELLDD